jgi:hypothetical protein
MLGRRQDGDKPASTQEGRHSHEGRGREAGRWSSGRAANREKYDLGDHQEAFRAVTLT